jgi:putative DNA primase/helicase
MRGGHIAMISEPPITMSEINELTGNLSSASDTRSATSPTLPSGFRMKESGLYLVGEDDKPDIFICGPIEVAGHTRDRHNESWGRLLRWRDTDGHLHSWAMPATVLAGDGSELRARLLDGGLSVSPNRKAREALIRFISEARPDTLVRCASQIGWHGQSFILPNLTIGTDSARSHLPG